jgi:hypothetical protein
MPPFTGTSSGKHMRTGNWRFETMGWKRQSADSNASKHIPENAALLTVGNEGFLYVASLICSCRAGGIAVLAPHLQQFMD